jgi:16S rRNA (uracil1498-N3)-methyltransferase
LSGRHEGEGQKSAERMREGDEREQTDGNPAGATSSARVAAQVFVEDLEALLLSQEDMHHLAGVLRLRDGEVVIAGDGQGNWRHCAVAATTGPTTGRGGATIELRPIGPLSHTVRGAPEITICFSLTKGDRPEWTVQKLTELGVDTLVPMISERTVARPAPAAAQQRLERLRRVAREAAMQSRRRWLPQVEMITELATIIGTKRDTPPCVAAAGGAPPCLGHPFVIVGPEGGFSERDLESLGPSPPTIGLGDLTLRSETAAVTAGALLVALRSGLVGEMSHPAS